LIFLILVGLVFLLPYTDVLLAELCDCWTDTSRVGTTRLWSSISFPQLSTEPLCSDISAELHKGCQCYLLDVTF